MQQDFFLVRKMQNGDESAMDVFVQKYYPQILQYCRYHCPDREWAQDLTQETFERFFRRLGNYHHSGKTLNYLYTIARNLCIDWERKNRELAAGEDLDGGGNGIVGLTGLVGLQGVGERGTTDRIDEKMEIEAALRKLPDEMREVIILHYFQGLSLREIAGILRISLPLTKYRIKKAKEQLRDSLESFA